MGRVVGPPHFCMLSMQSVPGNSNRYQTFHDTSLGVQEGRKGHAGGLHPQRPPFSRWGVGRDQRLHHFGVMEGPSAPVFIALVVW